MLGKASEIKFTHIHTKDSEFQNQIRGWKNSYPNAEVIDIKFSTTISHNSVVYEEGEPS
jgi:hypothetical protein